MKPKALAISIVITLFATLAISIRSTAQEQAARPRKQKEHHRYRLVDLGTFGGPEILNLSVLPEDRTNFLYAHQRIDDTVARTTNDLAFRID